MTRRGARDRASASLELGVNGPALRFGGVARSVFARKWTEVGDRRQRKALAFRVKAGSRADLRFHVDSGRIPKSGGKGRSRHTPQTARIQSELLAGTTRKLQIFCRETVNYKFCFFIFQYNAGIKRGRPGLRAHLQSNARLLGCEKVGALHTKRIDVGDASSLLYFCKAHLKTPAQQRRRAAAKCRPRRSEARLWTTMTFTRTHVAQWALRTSADVDRVRAFQIRCMVNISAERTEPTSHAPVPPRL
eukprot:scaffold1220_cov259-Pinguiococcus_pyrenoidosus.AAC.102